MSQGGVFHGRIFSRSYAPSRRPPSSPSGNRSGSAEPARYCPGMILMSGAIGSRHCRPVGHRCQGVGRFEPGAWPAPGAARLPALRAEQSTSGIQTLRYCRPGVGCRSSAPLHTAGMVVTSKQRPPRSMRPAMVAAPLLPRLSRRGSSRWPSLRLSASRAYALPSRKTSSEWRPSGRRWPSVRTTLAAAKRLRLSSIL